VVEVHPDLDAWREQAQPGRVFALAKIGTTRYTDVEFKAGDSFLFGPESVGLPLEVLEAEFVTDALNIPMQPDVRSLNLANAVAIVIYEAWRQHRFTLPEV
jgi:tRNA (cytidine/uridine-2'-O-)-methyltransferase